jgi:uncharacterized protein YkwD
MNACIHRSVHCLLAALVLVLSVGWQQLPEIPAYYRMNWRQFQALPAVHRTIDVLQPDYELLDAAFFHAANEARHKEHLPDWAYSSALHRSAAGHSDSMVENNFYGHEDRSNPARFYAHQRIVAAGGRFQAIGENIAQYELMATKRSYCPRKQPNGEYLYLDCTTQKPFPPYTYWAYAQRVVHGWMHSPSHRRNMFNPDFQFMACAVRVGKNPFRQRAAPFACITQNFGGSVAKSPAQPSVRNRP